MYAGQTAAAFTSTTIQSARSTGATFVLLFFAVGIARSWELLGLRDGGVLDFLVSRAHAPGREGHRAAEPDGGQPGGY